MGVNNAKLLPVGWKMCEQVLPLTILDGNKREARVVVLLGRWINFDIVESSKFTAVGYSFDANLIALV